jgi:hypothetical protein
MSASAAEASNDAAKPTDTERLQTHLAAGGLASQLLGAWLAGPGSQAQRRMLTVLDAHNSSLQATDAGPTPPKT